MANRFDVDESGQIDGDAQPPNPFSVFTTSASAPASGPPPWHLWGNSQRVDLTLAAGVFGVAGRGQINRIAYKRPETWHWLFTARLLEFPNAPALGTDLNISIIWELTVGIGRSIQQNLAFDVWNIPIAGGSAPPVGRLMWASETIPISPLNRNPADPNPPVNFIRQIPAQDIQLNVRAAITLGGAAVGYPYTAALDFGAQWAPVNHIRPDWFRDGPMAVQYAGAEVEGK